MATRRSLDAPPLFQSSCSRRPVKFHSDSLVTASLEELSLLLFIVVTICWLRGCFVSGQGTGPLVLKGHGCVGGARESFTVSESASRQSSHPGAVVFYGGVVDFLAGFWDYFLGRGGGDHPSLYRLKAEASAYSIWEEVQASCGASFIPALVAFARHWYVLELSPSVVLGLIDRESYELCGDHREIATPETSRELLASEKTRRTSLSRESR